MDLPGGYNAESDTNVPTRTRVLGNAPLGEILVARGVRERLQDSAEHPPRVHVVRLNLCAK